jgi:hypothetical protein
MFISSFSTEQKAPANEKNAKEGVSKALVMVGLEYVLKINVLHLSHTKPWKNRP